MLNHKSVLTSTSKHPGQDNMAGNLPVRLIICVDGTWFDPDGGNDKQGNVTNIYRFYASVGKGEFQDASGNR